MIMVNDNIEYDFGGYATRNDVECADGRVIKHNAFKECDNTTVPLVWQHDHVSSENVLGHALLENRDDGVYAYGTFNQTPSGKNARELVNNGDITALSIYANQLRQHGRDVVHGAIREVSLVLAGANPGAHIDTVLAHDYDDEEEAIITFGEELFHSASDDEKKDDTVSDNDQMADDQSTTANNEQKGKTIQDVVDSMNEEQKKVLYALVGAAAGAGEEDDEDEEENDTEVEHSAIYTEEDDENVMKHNVFSEGNTLKHDATDYSAIIRDGQRYGSLRESARQHGFEDGVYLKDVLQHDDDDYGITDIDYLFPDYKNYDKTPGFVSRDMEWVSNVMNGVSHTPFSRVRSIFADITADEARAKGYIKGDKKINEVFTLLKRTTDPQTVYKIQKLDRDDVVDITDFDVIAWLKGEMRIMLDEEIARAVLIGDGRDSAESTHISEDHIRPIWTDDDFYTIKTQVTVAEDADDDDIYPEIIKAAIKARKDYKGSGNPTFYTTEDVLTSMLLLTDGIGRDLYTSEEDLAKKLRVSKIVTVPVMEEQSREDGEDVYDLVGIIVNPKDYNIGADQGGSVSLFDDFDINYNQMQYLIETRCSGALIKPYSAIALEMTTSSSTSIDEETD